MTQRPTCLVLLASYNGETYIRLQIGSILEQAGVNVSIIVRDDGSNDQTVAIVEEIARRDGRVQLVSDEFGPTGWAAGNFFRLLMTADFNGSDFIAFADQDDVWLPNKLAHAAMTLMAEKADGYSSNLVAFDDAGLDPPYLLRKDQSQKRLDYIFQGGSAGCTYVLTRNAAEKLARWLQERFFTRELGLSHDWTTYAYVRAAGLRWVNSSVALILYRQHGSNQYGARGGLAGLKQRTAGMRSGWYRQHIRWLLENLPDQSGHKELNCKIDRLSHGDRLWLAARAGLMRRSRREALLLRAALFTGAFR